MTSCNRVILSGKVAKPPQLRYRPDGSPVVEFPLEWEDGPDASRRGARGLINIVAIGDVATGVAQRLQTGERLVVEGRLSQRNWQTPEGKRRSVTEVIATELKRVEEPSPIGRGMTH